MSHDLENPRTRRYSKLRSFIRDTELFFKKGFLFLFILINFVFHSKKKFLSTLKIIMKKIIDL